MTNNKIAVDNPGHMTHSIKNHVNFKNHIYKVCYYFVLRKHLLHEIPHAGHFFRNLN